MKYKNYLLISSLILIFILINACVKDTINVDDISDSANRKLTLDIPGGTLRTSIKDALEEFEIDTFLLVDDDGLLYINYKADFDVDWEYVLKIDDQSGIIGYKIDPFALSNSLKTTTGTGFSFESAEQIEFTSQQGAIIDSIYIKSGNMFFNFTLPAGTVDSIILGFPQLYINNKPYSDTLVASNIRNPYVINLDNALVDLETPTANKPSGYVEFTTKVVLVENPGIITSPDIFIEYNINDIEPDTIIGDFGKKVVADNDINITFETFDENYLGTAFEFNDFLIEVITENTYGVGFQAELSDIVFEDTRTMEQRSVILENGANIVRINQGERGDPLIPAFDTLTINKGNSNMEDILNLKEYIPNKISSKVVFTSNPTNEAYRNFLTSGSNIKSKLNMNIPLYLKTSKYSRKDTIDFNYNVDFEDDDDQSLSEKVDYGKLFLDFENGFPFDINVQFLFVDENYNLIDQLFDGSEGERLIESAKTDPATGLVTESTKSQFESTITNENLQKWKNGDVKYIIMETHAITDDGDKFVKVTENNFINTTISFSASGKIEN